MIEKVKIPVLIASAIYGAVVAIASVLIKGIMPYFLVGLILGVVMMNINFRLLGIGVDAYLREQTSRAVAIYVIRLVLYMVAGGLCFLASMDALIGYGIGVLSICAGGAGYIIKGDQIHD